MILTILFGAIIAFASDEHGHDHEDGFKISAEAKEAFNLKTTPLTAKTFDLPKSALVQSKETKSIFLIRNDWIKRVPVKIIKKSATTVFIELSDYEAGDQVVTEGTGFLRTTEVMAEEGPSHGHGH